MKKIIGIILVVLFIILPWCGLSVIFYNGGLSLLWSIILPPCVYIAAAIAAALLNGFFTLIEWLLKS